MSGKNIWLFGAGKWGEKYIKEYGKLKCKGFVDNSPERQGELFQEILVYGYDELKSQFDKENDIIYITTRAGMDQIILQLAEDGLLSFAKAYTPNTGQGIVDIRDAWNKVINSQLGEDVGLEHWFTCNGFLNGYKGFYLDIGAYHPFAYNNTRWAYELGWRGMNIDPNEQSIKLFNMFRPEDININCGVSDKNEELVYHIFEGAEGKNSFVEEENLQSVTATKVIKVRNINDILEEYHIEKIDFVDIDVEGFDERIVYSFNWKKYQPKCVLIELLGQNDIEAVLETSIHKKMREEGYALKSFYTVTALYIKKIY
ncbi:MAG: FkbM family methyltransferase [Roseburia sp.]|nr:FkbM family methyltransferase [Roseburia sp.]